MKVENAKSLDVNVFATRNLMGAAAGRDIEQKMKELLKEKEEIRMLFAAAPSQNEVLAYLAASAAPEWERVVAFHMDEYIGLPRTAPQLFAHYLNENLFQKVHFKQVHLINTQVPAENEIERYGALITEKPVDIVCLGIGENGHIAFNDPPVADFYDTAIVKKVALDHSCRAQQGHEGCFQQLEAVPQTALTLTIPVIMNAHYLFCIAPGSSKKAAVFNTLNGPVSESCPATILQQHPHCKFYFDEASYPLHPDE